MHHIKINFYDSDDSDEVAECVEISLEWEDATRLGWWVIVRGVVADYPLAHDEPPL